MHTVTSLLDELVQRANDRVPGSTGTLRLREMIKKAAGLDDAPTQPVIPMWKRRGIPWPMHDAMEAVCADLGVNADRKCFRATDEVPA